MGNSFEQLVKQLGLSPGEYENSARLKDWVRENMTEKYVPTDLLEAWGFEPDDVVNGEAA